MGAVTLLLAREDGGDPPRHLLLIALLTALFIISLVIFRTGGRLSAGVVLGLGLLMRLPLVAAPPVLSDDIHRYVWDGRVTLSGENPYRHGPLADGLIPLRDSGWRSINHPELPTIYPPAAQALFALAGGILPGVTGLKALLLLFDLGIALLVVRLSGGSSVGARNLLLYWWHPLPILEFAWSGHVDVAGLFFLLAALGLASRARGRKSRIASAGAGMALAAATLVKFLALPAAPFIAARAWKTTLAALAIGIVILYLPFSGDGVNSLGSLGTYVAKWRANDFFFSLFLRAGTPADQDLRLTGAKLAALSLVVGITLLVAVLRVPRIRAITIVLGSAILLSPTIHPWYVVWLVPFVAGSFSAPWFYVTLAALLAYHPQAGGTAVPDGSISWPRAIVMAPFLVLAGRDLWGEFTDRTGGAGHRQEDDRSGRDALLDRSEPPRAGVPD